MANKEKNQRPFMKLRGRIKSKFGSQENFATALFMNRQAVGWKLNKQGDFSKSDIVKWAKLLSIPKREIPDYFFEDWEDN